MRVEEEMERRDENIGLVDLKKNYWHTTKPILLDSLYIAAVMCCESSNIGLVVCKFRDSLTFFHLKMQYLYKICTTFYNIPVKGFLVFKSGAAFGVTASAN